MELAIGLIFLGVFAVVALVLTASGGGSARDAKRVQSSLESALATESQQTREQIVNLRKNEQFSAIPWLNEKLLKFELTPYLHRLLQQANLKWTAGRLLTMTAACFAVPAYLVYLRTDTLGAAIGMGIVASLAPLGWVRFQRGRRFQKFEQIFPEAIDLMVSGLRAGHSLIAAMGLVARECPEPVGSEFKICFDEQNYGLDLKIALDNLILRMPLQDLRIAVIAILIQKESGGNLAELLEKTSHTIRERFRLKRQVLVHTSQGRLTGMVLTMLPLVLGVVMYLVNPALMSVLWTRPLGVKLMWIASGMIVLGGLVIRNIVNMEV
jgi:tight adherence protein B